MTIIYPPDIYAKSMFYFKCPEQSIYILDVAKCSISESRNVLDEADYLANSDTKRYTHEEVFSRLKDKNKD